MIDKYTAKLVINDQLILVPVSRRKLLMNGLKNRVDFIEVSCRRAGCFCVSFVGELLIKTWDFSQ